MATLILCGLTDEETPEFLEAEHSLLDEITSQKGLNAAGVHTLRLKEIPDPADAEKVKALGRELLEAFGLGTGEFQTEFLEKNGFKFLAIHTAGESAPTVFVTGPLPEKPGRPPRRINWRVPALVFGGLVLLVILYYGLGYILTRVVNGQYADRNCESLVGVAGFVDKAYPLKLAPFTWTVRPQGVECRAWLEAESLYGQKNWEKASQAFREYEVTYPGGIYSKEAKELAAASLFELAAAQRGKADYVSAVDNLKLLLDEYHDTPSMTKARETLPEVYLEWGQAFCAGQKYSDAVIVYSSLVEWAAQEQDDALVTRANTELAEAYFEWGKLLQGKKDYSTASLMFNKALATDPNAAAADSTATKLHAYLPGFQLEWANNLLSQKKYPDAIDHFKTYATIVDQKDRDDARNILSQAYLAWAESLRQGEDFIQALSKIGMAKDSAADDANRGKAEEAQANTLDSYSRSTGSQARGVITNTTRSICDSQRPATSLPIVGILPEKRLVVIGLTLSLPNTILARSPGSLYYVACAEERQATVQDCPYSPTGYGYFAPYHIYRISYSWNIKLYHSQTGKLYRENTFAGSSPELCPYRHSFNILGIHYHYGEKPSIDSVINWLSYFVK